MERLENSILGLNIVFFFYLFFLKKNKDDLTNILEICFSSAIVSTGNLPKENISGSWGNMFNFRLIFTDCLPTEVIFIVTKSLLAFPVLSIIDFKMFCKYIGEKW